MADLHALAVNAEHALEQLATEMGKAGADPAAIDAVSKMANVSRKLVLVLGKGQEQTGDQEPPAPAPAEAPAPAHTMESATAGLHHDMQASAAQRPA